MLSIVGVVCVVAYLFHQYGAIEETRALERENQARANAAAEECERQRADQIERATRRYTDARAVLNRCKKQFEDTRTIFTSATVATYCRRPYAALNVAGRDLKEAKALPCPSTATGSLLAPSSK
jgi:hypothetical protein